MSEPTKYTLDEWRAEAARRFGPDALTWAFVCPVCGNVAEVRDYERFKEAGATPESAVSECIGRYTNGRDAFSEAPGKPCNYAGYGLFRLSPVRVVTADRESHAFAFAEPRVAP